MTRRTIVVLSGAGMSAESGLATFRGSGGLWEGYNVMDVATPEAWERDPGLVLRFYNWRRAEVRKALPNAAHRALVELEKYHDVSIVTQNIDDLHERAGSRRVLHLHGEILKARSTLEPDLIYDLEGKDIHPGDRCERGGQLRPHVVWFGEPVPEIFRALTLVEAADVLVVVGTSLNVYPAASLVTAVGPACEIIVVNPEVPGMAEDAGYLLVRKTVGEGIPEIVTQLIAG